MPRLLRLALGAVTGLLAALLYLGIRGTGPEAPDPLGGQDPFLASPVEAPPLTLTDPDGRSVSLADFRGRVVALFFGYTQCPDVCPITLAQLARLDEEIDAGGELEIVFVSLDPARDTPAELQRFGDRLHPDLVALTGPIEELRPQVLEYGIGFVYRPRAGGPADSVPPGIVSGEAGGGSASGGAESMGDDYLVDHTARTFVIDRGGRLVAQVLPETRGDVLREVVERVLEGGT